MRISDWMSDVCSSDLIGIADQAKDQYRRDMDQAAQEDMDSSHGSSTPDRPHWFRRHRIAEMIGDAEMRLSIPFLKPGRHGFDRDRQGVGGQKIGRAHV